MTNIQDDARHKWPALLIQMLDSGAESAQQCGLDSHKAEEVTMTTLSNYTLLFGGLQIYLPKGDAFRRALRDREIYKQAGRTDVAILAQRYNLSMKQIWEIQRTQYKLHIQRVQPSLL